jgi:hypothetical protein
LPVFSFSVRRDATGLIITINLKKSIPLSLLQTIAERIPGG